MSNAPETLLQSPDRVAAPPSDGPSLAHRIDFLADASLTLRAAGALVSANARYWTTVAPLLRAELAGWSTRARAIPDPMLRDLAMSKLRDESFNVEVAATMATLAPRSQRGDVVRAIVAVQVIYDYLDLLTEQPMPDPSAGRELFAAFLDAVTLDRPVAGDYYRSFSHSDDGGYLAALVAASTESLSRLPAAAAVADVSRAAAERCADAQLLIHATEQSGTREVEDWATREAEHTDLHWPEFLAGATASVLTVHAVIAAAADPSTTPADAEALDAIYLSIGALTMLDYLVDREQDAGIGGLRYDRLYDSPQAMATALLGVARRATTRAGALSTGPHHVMTLVGAVAYYTSAPAADSAFARPVTRPVRDGLRPLITPTLAVMRVWRLAKRIRRA